MSIKDELQHVKDELSGDEKVLESAFKLERFYKKNKTTVWAVLALAILGFGGNAAWNAYQQNKLDTANTAFLTLQKNPKDTEALDTLKTNNPKLYALYDLSEALKSGSVEPLKSLASSADPLIADIASYHAGVLDEKAVDSTYFHDLSVVEEAWTDLKDGKKTEAKSKLSLVAEDSPLAKIAQLLRHYTIELK